MPFHLDPVAVDVDRLPALLGELDGELEWEPVGRREHEGLLARDRLATGELVEEPKTALERLREALLLVLDDLRDLVGLAPKLGIGVAHLLDDDRRQPMEVAEPDALRLLHCPPDDPPQNVATPLVRRGD